MQFPLIATALLYNQIVMQIQLRKISPNPSFQRSIFTYTYLPITLYVLFTLLTYSLSAQGPLERAVQVSATVQNDPPRIDFSWAWDFSGPDYTIYRKRPGAADWGTPRAVLPWQATEWSDTDVEEGVAYEYAFFKRRWQDILDTVCVAGGTELTFTINNVFGDGLCCNFGFGNYEVSGCNQIFAAGSDFGFTKDHHFTVCGNANECAEVLIKIKPDMLPNNTWWSLENTQTGEVVIDSGEPRTNLAERAKYGFIQTGIAVPAIEDRGTILLLIDDILMDSLDFEITQLEDDFRADGWRVKERKISRSETVPNVKNLIRTINSQTDDLTAVMLLGHIPVPYSGNFYADGHSENHWGAWAADVFYADLDGEWTDNTVSNSSALFERNHNHPGDGKYDQSALPSPADLQIGRVDFFNMPAFAKTEIELTRQYLQKLHLFKTGQRDVERRGLVDDNLGIVLGAPGASAYRNFAPMFGAENIIAGDYFTDMQNGSYLWSYGGGGGSHTSAAGIGTTQDFTTASLQNIFTMLIGSQFGDWDNVDNFLRAPLASEGWMLTSCWVGNPPWTLHHMGQGYHMGYSLLQTQNSTINNYHPGPQLVHTSLLGDPTLRLHPIKMPQNVIAVANENNIQLTWQASLDENVIGYHVYRQNQQNLKFERLTDEAQTELFYTDNNPLEFDNHYFIKAVKLEISGSGTYYNMSLGAAAFAEFLTPIIECCPTKQNPQKWSIYPNPSSGKISIAATSGEYVWKSDHSAKDKYDTINIYNNQGQLVKAINAEQVSMTGIQLDTGLYFIKWQGQVEKVVIE